MLLLLALILLVLEMVFLTQKRVEDMLPVVAGTAVIVCYGLGMFQALALFSWLVYALVTVGLVWCLFTSINAGMGRRTQAFVQNAFTPGLVVFIAVVTFLVFAASPHRVTHTDEVYVWAIQPNSLFYHEGFVDQYQHLSPRFMTYMPGVHLFQWIGLAILGEWNEGALFLWLWLLYAILLIPFTRHLQWKNAWQMPLYVLGIVLFPVVFNVEAYQILRVDTALGIGTAYATVQAWRFAHEKSNRAFLGVSLAVALSLMTLIKQPGIGWVLIPLAVYLLSRPKLLGRARSKGFWALLVAPLLTFSSWLLFCHIKGLTGQHLNLLADNSAQILSGQLPYVGDLLAVCAALLRETTRVVSTVVHGLFEIPQIGWLCVFLLFPLILYRAGRIDRRVTIRLVVLLLVSYALILLLFFVALFTTFRPEWTSPVDPSSMAGLLSNLQRYGCALWYALLALYAEICLNSDKPALTAESQPNTRVWIRVPVGVLTIIILVSLPWTILHENLISGHYPEQMLTEELDSLAENAFWTEDLQDPNAIVLLASDSYPFNRGWLQYALAPMKLVMPYETHWTTYSLRQLLADYHIRYFVSDGMENPLYEAAAAFAQDGYLDPYTVYSLQWNGDEPMLVSIEQCSTHTKSVPP